MSGDLALRGLRVGYPGPAGMQVVVDDVGLSLAPGEIGCLLGTSGCGKTTVLRAIAGFEPVMAGQVVLDGRVLASAGGGLPPEQRRVGTMFQDYALFPHLRVADNVAFGLPRRPRATRDARVAAMVALAGLAHAARAYPHELSGGQQQRVALARALAPGPALLLLDEPFSNLDASTRARLAGELRALLKATGTTVLMVTHDQSEAFAMADRIGVMAAGRILQWDTAQALYARPADREVAGFIGRGDWVPGDALGLDAGVDVRLRPGQLLPDPAGALHGVVEAVAFRGPGHVATVRLPGGAQVAVEVADGDALRVGDGCRLRLADTALLTFPR